MLAILLYRYFASLITAIAWTIKTANILPPPDDLSLPIVKLLTHPAYYDYQSQTAALSLYANLNIKFLPPIWPSDGQVDKKEWQRRIKMYGMYMFHFPGEE